MTSVQTRPRGARAELERLEAWFAARGWTPWPYQRRAWQAALQGRSGLISVATGAGKTYAAYLGPLAQLAASPGPGLRMCYITPLRAVARDIELAMRAPVAELRLPVTIESRTGDTSQTIRARQRTRLANVLITTPESLSLLLTRENAGELFASLRTVIVDEWHELLSSKRGTQVELALSRLRALAPQMNAWALSATIANIEEAAQAIVGTGPAHPAAVRPAGASAAAAEPEIITADIPRPVRIEGLIPSRVESFPWAGRLGLWMLDDLLQWLDPDRSTLIFTNVRSHAERWYRAITLARPEWQARAALHHGSIDRAERERVEAGVKSGAITLVVCTSSLDLGVDFAPVERVVQIGSPKGVARLIQRAGRSSHRPGAACEILCVPTHGLELLEIAAVRRAVAEGRIEPRDPVRKPLDALAQHMVTCALGGGFGADELFEQVRTAWSYRELTRREFDWTLALVREGGGTLAAYPDFCKVLQVDGVYQCARPRIGQLHRLNIGTITSTPTLDLRFVSGSRIGQVEDDFIARLRPGDRFFFAGRALEFVSLHDDTAFVRPARRNPTLTPIWAGTRLPISESLSSAIRRALEDARDGRMAEPEALAAAPIFAAQQRLSVIPGAGETLIELCRTRDGDRMFIFPFEGQLVHAGIASLLALRLGRRRPATFTTSHNDYGFELMAEGEFDFEASITPDLFSTDELARDALDSVNSSALAKRQFREIARVAGLVFQHYPGARKPGRQVQANSSLIYDVYEQFDPENQLLVQAKREVLENQFQRSRLALCLERLRRGPLRIVRTPRPTPLAFPLVAQSIGTQTMSFESTASRLERLQKQWDKEEARWAASRN
ncbi:MAG: ligase-associated DNA damage response DEXH box helicase [Phycisphaerales bacterium JB039]